MVGEIAGYLVSWVVLVATWPDGVKEIIEQMTRLTRISVRMVRASMGAGREVRACYQRLCVPAAKTSRIGWIVVQSRDKTPQRRTR